jgi:hypothetical protein
MAQQQQQQKQQQQPEQDIYAVGQEGITFCTRFAVCSTCKAKGNTAP